VVAEDALGIAMYRRATPEGGITAPPRHRESVSRVGLTTGTGVVDMQESLTTSPLVQEGSSRVTQSASQPRATKPQLEGQ
jgi:hypothetical protein